MATALINKKAKAAPRKAANSSAEALRPTTPGDALMKIIQPKVQDRWMGLVRRDWTPEAVRQTLDASSYQRLYQLFRLFEMMEDTWPRLAKNLHDVRSAVAKVEWTVQPYTLKGKKASPSAMKKAEFVEQCLFGMKGDPLTGQNGWHGTVYDLMDAYGKGLAVLEVDWKRHIDGTTVPSGTRWLRPIHFDYPLYNANADERLLLCRSGDLTQYEEFPKDHFLVGVYRTRSAVQATLGGIMRRLAPLWVFGNLSLEWLVNFAQLFGVPLRWATYNTRHTDQLSVLSSMLENMGSAGWGAFPEGTNLNLLDSSKSGTDNPQTAILDRADKACDMLILGQTLTSDVGDSGSRALGDVHAGIRDDRIVDASEWVGETITNQLVTSIVRLNFGNEEEMPVVSPVRDQQEDSMIMANRDKVLFNDMGLPVSLSYLYERHDVPEPGPNDSLFEKPAPPAPPGFGGGPGGGGPPAPGDEMPFGAKEGFVSGGQPCGDSFIPDEETCRLGEGVREKITDSRKLKRVSIDDMTRLMKQRGFAMQKGGGTAPDESGKWVTKFNFKDGKGDAHTFTADQIKKLISSKAGAVEASAHLDDVRLTDLPEDTVDTIRNFINVSPRSRLSVPRYSMTTGELVPKTDPHNLEAAREKMKDLEPEAAAQEVRGRQDVKHILLMNDRVIDGHHFIAKAERGGYTAGLKVLDLTSARFQAKAGQELPQGVALALAKLPPERQRRLLQKIHEATAT